MIVSFLVAVLVGAIIGFFWGLSKVLASGRRAIADIKSIPIDDSRAARTQRAQAVGYQQGLMLGAGYFGGALGAIAGAILGAIYDLVTYLHILG